MKLAEVVTASRRISKTRSRLEKTDLLAGLLSGAASEEIDLVVSYLAGRLPGGRLGVGNRTLEVLRRVVGVAEPTLELKEVDAAFEELRALVGSGSGRARSECLRELYRRATEAEQGFLSRLLLGDLRQGSLEGIMVEAVAKAARIESTEVRRALMVSGDLAAVTRAALRGGARELAAFQIELFRPIQPMLAQTAEDVADALATLETAALEPKLDGARIQVHKRKNEVKVFTRRLNDVTAACPEVAEEIRGLEIESLVVDGEAIALRPDGRPHPFQVTMRRFGRRLDVAAMRRALPLTSVYFDCLYADGVSLIEASAEERYRCLSESLPPELVVPRLVTNDPEEARDFVDETLAAGHEGVMAKALDAPYEAGARGKAWLKLKSAHTLDLVVLAAEWGSGRRRGWLSNLHLGARDPDTDGWVMLGKTFKGMTDAILEWQTEKLQQIEISRDEWTVYVRPELVVEVAFDGLQKSPHYPGGLALRFARLKSYREDKRVEDADTIETAREIYRRQTGEAPDEGETQLTLFANEKDHTT